jgi:branched-chain amino acid transport system substrate-binding protein
MKVRFGSVAVLCAAAAIGLGACGSDDSGDTTGAAAAATPTSSTPAAAGGLDQATIDVGVQFTGGTAGKADAGLAPVTIGYVNEKGGTPSFPENEAAADAAVQFVNENLGGIGGHPLKLNKCVVSAEEDGQKCGAAMANAKVPLVSQSILVLGAASFHKTLGTTTPVVISAPSDASDNTTKDRYTFNGAGQAILAGMVQDAKKRGIKSVAIASVGNPAGKYAIEKILIPQLKAAGISHGKVVYFPEGATTPDVVSALQAAGASKTDSVMFTPSGPGQCVSIYDGLKQLNLKNQVVTTLLCNADEFVEHTGAGPEGWSLWSFNKNQRIESDPQVKAFNAVMKAYGAEKYANVGLVVPVFSDIITIAKLANTIGADNISSSTFRTAIKAFRGPVFMIPGTPRCDSPPDENTPTLCGNAAAGSIYRDGSWQDLGAITNQAKQTG